MPETPAQANPAANPPPNPGVPENPGNPEIWSTTWPKMEDAGRKVRCLDYRGGIIEGTLRYDRLAYPIEDNPPEPTWYLELDDGIKVNFYERWRWRFLPQIGQPT
jgi:hypothetical protein